MAYRDCYFADRSQVCVIPSFRNIIIIIILMLLTIIIDMKVCWFRVCVIQAVLLIKRLEQCYESMILKQVLWVQQSLPADVIQFYLYYSSIIAVL